MPRSRSRSLESRIRSPWSWEARNWPDWRSIASTRVVLPWSTWAMMATFRMSSRRFMDLLPPARGRVGGWVRARAIETNSHPARRESSNIIRERRFRTRAVVTARCMMDHTEVTQFVGMLVVILALAKLAGAVAQRLGQPAVLGELIGGVLAGPSVLGWVEPGLRGHPPPRGAGRADPAVRDRPGDGSLAAASGWGHVAWPSPWSASCCPFVLGFAACRLIGLIGHAFDHGGGDPDGDERRDHRPRPLRPGPPGHPGGPDHPRRGADR